MRVLLDQAPEGVFGVRAFARLLEGHAFFVKRLGSGIAFGVRLKDFVVFARRIGEIFARELAFPNIKLGLRGKLRLRVLAQKIAKPDKRQVVVAALIVVVGQLDTHPRASKAPGRRFR